MIKYQISSINYQVSSIKYQKQNIKYQVSSINNQVSNIILFQLKGKILLMNTLFRIQTLLMTSSAGSVTLGDTS